MKPTMNRLMLVMLLIVAPILAGLTAIPSRPAGRLPQETLWAVGFTTEEADQEVALVVARDSSEARTQVATPHFLQTPIGRYGRDYWLQLARFDVAPGQAVPVRIVVGR